MRRWLTIAAICPLFAASAAQSQIKSMSIDEIASAKSRALDLRLSQPIDSAYSLPMAGGMIVQRKVAPNARVGVGLLNMFAKKMGPDWRVEGRSGRSRKPAVTFVLKF
jgi:hypothetical protein